MLARVIQLPSWEIFFEVKCEYRITSQILMYDSYIYPLLCLQSMFIHRPLLSLLTGLCMIGVVCFYITICWQSHRNKPSAAEIKIRKVARARKRKEELEKREAETTRQRIEAKELAVAKSRDKVKLKRRDKNAELEEVQNGTENGSDDETGSSDAQDTQSGSEDDSQIET